MKKLFLSIIIMITGFMCNAQCTTCNSFSEALTNPEKVTAIKINSMRDDLMLKEIPADVSKFINLKTLWLSSHEIKTINEAVCKLESLESLSSAENQLTAIPDCIYEMKNLKEIILINNLLSVETKKSIKSRFAKINPELKVMLDM